MPTDPSSVSFDPHLFLLEKINEKLAETVEPATEYQVISSIDPAKLAQHVERAMKMGWRCQGGVAMATLTAVEPVWAQAMVH